MIKEVEDYLGSHKVVTPRLMARDLEMDEDQLKMILDLLQISGKLALGEGSCKLGICTPKDKLNCGKDCH